MSRVRGELQARIDTFAYGAAMLIKRSADGVFNIVETSALKALCHPMHSSSDGDDVSGWGVVLGTRMLTVDVLG